mmetsp:Transcript_31175/g.66338  ORF Transcript_31175/g.66338 Transcript_31175/m.66338 type:complete len:322 (-) Transcript_31175:187-1152(-)
MAARLACHPAAPCLCRLLRHVGPVLQRCSKPPQSLFRLVQLVWHPAALRPYRLPRQIRPVPQERRSKPPRFCFRLVQLMCQVAAQLACPLAEARCNKPPHSPCYLGQSLRHLAMLRPGILSRHVGPAPQATRSQPLRSILRLVQLDCRLATQRRSHLSAQSTCLGALCAGHVPRRSNVGLMPHAARPPQLATCFFALRAHLAAGSSWPVVAPPTRRPHLATWLLALQAHLAAGSSLPDLAPSLPHPVQREHGPPRRPCSRTQNWGACRRMDPCRQRSCHLRLHHWWHRPAPAVPQRSWLPMSGARAEASRQQEPGWQERSW